MAHVTIYIWLIDTKHFSSYLIVFNFILTLQYKNKEIMTICKRINCFRIAFTNSIKLANYFVNKLNSQWLVFDFSGYCENVFAFLCYTNIYKGHTFIFSFEVLNFSWTGHGLMYLNNSEYSFAKGIKRYLCRKFSLFVLVCLFDLTSKQLFWFECHWYI